MLRKFLCLAMRDIFNRKAMDTRNHTVRFSGHVMWQTVIPETSKVLLFLNTSCVIVIVIVIGSVDISRMRDFMLR